MVTEKQGMILAYAWMPYLNAIDPTDAMKMLNALVELDRTGTTDLDVKDPLQSAVFEAMKEKVLRNRSEYLKKCEVNKTNGAKGGRPRNPKKPNGFQKNPEKPDSDSDSDSDRDRYIKRPKWINFTERNYSSNDYAEISTAMERR